MVNKHFESQLTFGFLRPKHITTSQESKNKYSMTIIMNLGTSKNYPSYSIVRGISQETFEWNQGTTPTCRYQKSTYIKSEQTPGSRQTKLIIKNICVYVGP